MRAVLLLALAAAVTSAASIKWTGYGNDNQWTNKVNWNTDTVPGQNDDVTIESGVVQCTVATAVNSLTMGFNVNTPANLTLFQAFIVGAGGMSVEANGNLFVNTGLQQVFGQVTIGGTLQFIDGVLGGAWTVTKRAYANLGNGGEKGFSGCTFQCNGGLSIAGVIQLNQSSQFILGSATSSTNLIIQNGDGSAVLFDASHAAFTFSTGTLIIQAPVLFGTFTLQSGNITVLNTMSFDSTLNIPTGSYVTCLGSAVVNLTAGVTGSGVLTLATQTANIGNIAMTGAVNFNGGAVIVQSTSSMGILSLAGANSVFNAAVYPAQLNIMTGTCTGAGMITATNVMISTKGFTLGCVVTANSTASFMDAILTFGMEGGFTIASGARGTTTGALQLTGPAYIPGLVNNGVFQADSNVLSQNIDITGSGTITVTATLDVNTAKVSQASVTLSSGATFMGEHTFLTLGKVASATGGDVKATIGDYKLTCKGECDNISTPGTTTPTSSFTFTA